MTIQRLRASPEGIRAAKTALTDKTWSQHKLATALGITRQLCVASRDASASPLLTLGEASAKGEEKALRCANKILALKTFSDSYLNPDCSKIPQGNFAEAE